MKMLNLFSAKVLTFNTSVLMEHLGTETIEAIKICWAYSY